MDFCNRFLEIREHANGEAGSAVVLVAPRSADERAGRKPGRGEQGGRDQEKQRQRKDDKHGTQHAPDRAAGWCRNLDRPGKPGKSSRGGRREGVGYPTTGQTCEGPHASNLKDASDGAADRYGNAEKPPREGRLLVRSGFAGLSLVRISVTERGPHGPERQEPGRAEQEGAEGEGDQPEH